MLTLQDRIASRNIPTNDRHIGQILGLNIGGVFLNVDISFGMSFSNEKEDIQTNFK